MQPHTPAEAAILEGTNYGVYSQLRLSRGVPFAAGTAEVLAQDLLGYDPFLSAKVSADLDQPVVFGDYQLHLGTGATNLSPFVDGPVWPGTARPLLDPGIYLSHYVKCSPNEPGSGVFEQLPWAPLFCGRIDSIDPAVDQDDVLDVQCRDFLSDLLDRWIEPVNQEIDAHEMQDLPIESLLGLLKSIGMGESQANYTVTLTGTPKLLVPAYFQDPMSTLLAMRQVGLLNGWDLRGRWTDVFGVRKWTLTYYEPDRLLTTTPLVLKPGRYFAIPRLSKTRDEVRNAWRVIPAGNPRTPIDDFNQQSIDDYGRRWAQLSEDRFSGVVTHEQGLALIAAILSDTKSPKIQADIVMPFYPYLEINDLLSLESDGTLIGNALPVAVSGFEQNVYANGHADTLAHTRDAPAAANREWREGPAKMTYVSTHPPSGPAHEGAQWDRFE